MHSKPSKFPFLTLVVHLLMACMVFLAHMLFWRMTVLFVIPFLGLASHADRFSLCHVLAALPSLALLHLLSLRAFGRGEFRKFVGLSPLAWPWSLSALALSPVLYLAYLFFSRLLAHTPTGGFVQALYLDANQPMLLVAALCLAAPLFEELLFRGFFQSVLLRWGCPAWLSISAASFTWTILHSQYGLVDLSLLFCTGLIMGFLRYRSGSLWPALAMHTGINLTALIHAIMSLEYT